MVTMEMAGHAAAMFVKVTMSENKMVTCSNFSKMIYKRVSNIDTTTLSYTKYVASMLTILSDPGNNIISFIDKAN